MDGIINLYKHKGITSFDAVKMVRNISGEKKCGHGGTLDPLAEGVLPVFLGKATRIIPFMPAIEDGEKKYSAMIRLGISTDTLDSEGTVVATYEGEKTPALEDVQKAVESFRGTIRQVPPMFSAVKHKGKRLYKLAREGKVVERMPREVEIKEIEIVSFEYPFLKINVTCSAGTYIRVLASDIGDMLGCGGHISELVRLRSGAFDIDGSKRIDEVREAGAKGILIGIVHGIDSILSSLAEVHVTDTGEKRVRDGASVTMENVVSVNGALFDTGYCRIKGEGQLLAIGQSMAPDADGQSEDKDYVFKIKRVFVN